eukprot:CAMPEP_0196997406 /NCGR_PEP_ID=MMETSP1380-20130617/3024_1 /TAXON_ID=5936 /ORGANISM="Euplotes crassus, Strain CT5" /LENGTH=365 /DNA_ID=CAMNT_0042413627 /DNA_START=837 /DNA_END=1936 /DNA_ORIENTATION=-
MKMYLGNIQSMSYANCPFKIGKGVELTLKKSAYLRSLDNITVVVVAFEGFSKLFNPPIISEVESEKYPINNSQLKSIDRIRKRMAQEDPNRVSKIPNQVESSVSNLWHNKTQFQDDASTEGRKMSSKQSETSMRQRNTSNDERNLQDGVKLYQVKKMNNSLKDAKAEKLNKTPSLMKNSKLEGLSHLDNFSYNDGLSKSAKHKPGIIKMKNQGSRNSTIHSTHKMGLTDKHHESLTDKFMRKSEEFNNKRAQINSKSLSKSKNQKLDFGSLSINSRRKNKNKDTKDSLLSLSNRAKESINANLTSNPIRSLIDHSSVGKKRIMSGSKIIKSSTHDPKEDSSTSIESQFQKLNDSQKELKPENTLN